MYIKYVLLYFKTSIRLPDFKSQQLLPSFRTPECSLTNLHFPELLPCDIFHFHNSLVSFTGREITKGDNPSYNPDLNKVVHNISLLDKLTITFLHTPTNKVHSHTN